MNQFIKNAFSSCLGVFLAIVAGFGLLAIIGVSAAMSGSGKPSLKDNTVLDLHFDKMMPELTNNTERSFGEANEDVLGVKDYVDVLAHARDDKKIKGAILHLEDATSIGGFATSEKVRQAILDFKKSGKFVYAYAESYNRGSYYIASAADTIIVNPLGGIDFKGIGGVYMFYKDLFDHLGINPQVYYAGKFKGATEPYRYTKFSEENKYQIRTLLDTFYNHYLNELALSRKLPADTLRAYADRYAVRSAHVAVQLKMADVVGYEDDLEDIIRKKLNIKEKDKLRTLEINEYNKTFTKKETGSGSDRIAVVYAEGPLMGGTEAVDGNIIQEPYRDIFKKLSDDKNVKAIVIRVNSPGGSALTSEVIHQEIERCKKAGKKIVVSMGDVAASGGYYIACNADSIFAEANTVTGSIGVYSFMPGTQKFFNEKLHIHYDTIKTSKYATFMSGAYDNSPEESQILQESVDTMYQTFLSRVAKGRHMSVDSVHAIAQGRVWSGYAALQNGLVDRIGSLDDAVACAARLAGITKYKIKTYPTPTDPIQQLIKQIMGQANTEKLAHAALVRELGPLYEHYATLRSLSAEKGPQMRMQWTFPMN